VLAAALGGCGGPEPAAGTADERKRRRPNLLLITVDTLRADHLSAWGYPRPTSPRIDRLGAEGARFAAAQVQWPKTGPSFASMFTSTYPKDNGNVRQIGIPLPCEFTTLAERLQRSGYQTRAIVANGALAREFNFDQGFDRYLEAWQEPHPEGGDPIRAENVTRLAIATAEELDRARPWFLWVHYIDPHFPYEAPKPWRGRFQDDEIFERDLRRIRLLDKHSNQMGGIGRRQTVGHQDRLAFYVARYDAEIAYTDEQIGVLLDRLGQDGLLAETLTALTSDHGESLGEHNYYFDHGRFAFQTCLHVPFILHWPGRIEPRVEREPVELLDLAPTLLEAARLLEPGAGWAQGSSLWPVLRGEARPASPVFSEGGTATRGNWIKTAREGRFQLHHTRMGAEQRWIGGPGVDLVLYDLEADPGETVNVAAMHPEVTERLKRQLWNWWNEPRFDTRTDDQIECGAGREVESDTTEQLRALGYL
jgi:arylsulfatase A-like enzyme